MSQSTRYQTVVRVSVVNGGVNTLLALLKIIMGYLGHSQALIADGIHSLSDLLTDALVLVAARMGDQVPDKEHPYGHHRFETIGAIIIAIVLIGVAVGIVFDTIHHLINAQHLIKPNIYAAVIAFISIIANEGLFHYTLAQGNKINSDLLRTNAWHNRSDVLVSIIVMVSVIGTMLGVVYLDAIGALIIAVLILKISITLIWQAVKELIDTAVDEQTLQQITTIILQVPGVIASHQLRTRSHGGLIFIDVHIQVNPRITVSEGHYIGEQVEQHLMKQLTHIADVTVHVDPEDDETSMPSIDLPTRQEIDRVLQQRWRALHGYQHIQHIRLHYLDGKLHVGICLPLTLLQTHRQPTALINAYCAKVQDIEYIADISFYFYAGSNGQN